MKINSLSVSPMPILAPGHIHLSLHAELTRTVPALQIQFTFRKHTIAGLVRIPCIGDVGSCKFDGCTILDGGSGSAQTNNVASQVKTMFHKSGISFHCPVHKQSMVVANYDIQLPDLGGIQSALSDGDYTVTIELIEAGTLTQLGCTEFESSIHRVACSGWLCSGGRK